MSAPAPGHQHRHGYRRAPEPVSGRRLLAWAAVLAAAGAGLWRLSRSSPPQIAALAVEAEDAAAVCQAPACRLGDFWDRAAAAGVSAVVLRECPLKELALRGEVLHVTREEFDKWQALGIVSPGATLKPDTIWVKDPQVLAQVLEAVERQGVSVSTASSAGYVLVQFPDGYAAASESLGAYDAETLASLDGHSLAKIFSESQGLALKPVGLRWQADGRLAGYAGLPGDWTLMPRLLDASCARAVLLRAAFSDPARLLVLRLSPQDGVDGAIERLRQARAALVAAGLTPGLPARAPSRPRPAAPAWLLAAALWSLGLVGPLLAARAGLSALKAARAQAAARWPVASPVLQLAAGLACETAAAAAMGLAARACLESLGFPGPSPAWVRFSVVAPVIVGLLTLYTIDLAQWAVVLAKPLSRGQALAAAALTAAGALVLDPRSIVISAGLWPALRQLESFAGPLWWLPWRWRETLIGVPCLLYAMFLIDWRLDCPDCASLSGGTLNDARTWFLPGLLAPVGVAAAVARRGTPLALTLEQTAAALAIGSVLGAFLIVARMRRAHRAAVAPRPEGQACDAVN